MKYFLLVVTIFTMASCMKSKDEYQAAISDVQEEQEAEGDREIQRKIQREEERNDQRSRGSNDAEGMGMDE